MSDESRDEDEFGDREVEFEVNEVVEPTDAFQPATEESTSRSSSSSSSGRAETEADCVGSGEGDSVGRAGELNEVVEPTGAFEPATEEDSSGDGRDGGGGGE